MKLSRWFAAIFIIVITISSLGFAKFQQIQAAIAMAESFPEPSAAVNSFTTKARDYSASYTTTGQATATEVITVQNELQGIISKVNYLPGKRVKKGQLLLSLNTVEEETQLEAAKANLTLAKNNFSRAKKLLNKKRISQQEYDSSKAQLLVTTANVANLKAIISKKQIIAPFDSFAGLESFQLGQFLPMNSKITTLVGVNKTVWIDFQVAQTQSKLQLGDTIQVSAISSSNNKEYQATIIAKNSQIKAKSRHMTYRAELINGRNWLEHNEIVNIRILSPSSPHILVPSSAVSRDHRGNYLYALVQDENQQYRAKKISVELGDRVADEQIITAGIDEGILIATEGAFKLREGLLVYTSKEQ